MGSFRRDRTAQRDGIHTLLSNPAGWLYEAFGITATDSGVDVSPKSALKFTAVYACVNVLAQSIAQIPWDVYRKDADGKKKQVARDRTEHYLLHSEPLGHDVLIQLPRGTSSQTFCYTATATSRSFATAQIALPDCGCSPPGMCRLRVARCNAAGLQRDAARGKVDTLDGSDVIHIPCLSLDGIAGLSPIQQHRQAVGLGLAAETAGAAFFGNGSRPSGYLSTGSRLQREGQERARGAMEEIRPVRRTHGKVPICPAT
jgi:phage portal protein BeeE